MKSNRKKLTFSIILVGIISIAVLFFLLRGPYLSNTIKRAIVPVLQNVTGERIIIDNAAINLFPFYFQAKGLKVFDKNGNMLLWITKTRVYTDLLGLLTREFRVRRLTLKGPNLTVGREDLERVRQGVRRYMSAGRGGNYRFSIKHIKVTEGKFSLSGPGRIRNFSGNGLFAEITVKKRTVADISLSEGFLNIQDRPELKFELDGNLVKREDGKIDISGLRLSSAESFLDAQGIVELSEEGGIVDGHIHGKAKVLEKSINRFYDVPNESDGELSFSGTVKLLGDSTSWWPRFSLDLDADGWFHLESLMKILRVTSNVTGRLAVDGRIIGVYPDLTGKGAGSLTKAGFGHLQLDDVSGKLRYGEKKFLLDDFIAHSLKGELRGSASVALPHGDYSVTAGYQDVNSRMFLDYISWDAPFPEGSMSGDFRLEKVHGKDMHIVADIDYLNTSPQGGDLFQRMEGFSGGLDYNERSVVITEGTFRTGHSQLALEGTVDLANRSLSLSFDLKSPDVSDLTEPSITFIRAPVQITGLASGPYSNPEISGSFSMGAGRIQKLLFSDAAGDFTYRVGSLSSEGLKIRHDKATYGIAGAILFPEADRLFSIDDPFFRASVDVDGGDLEELARVLHGELPVSGAVTGEMVIEGSPENLRGHGKLVIENGVLFKQTFDKIALDTGFGPDRIEIPYVELLRGKSKVSAEGYFAFDDTFRLTASSDEIDLRDIDLLDEYPVEALASFELGGSGEFSDPVADFSLKLIESSVWKVDTGSGEIKGRLKDGKVKASGDILDGTVTVEAGIDLSDPVSWTLDLDLHKGRYDSLLASLLGEAENDLSASLEGNASLSGSGDDITMSTRLTSAHFDLYGYSFRNKGDIAVELDGGRLKIETLSLTGEDGDFTVSGYLTVKKDFNIKMVGNFNVTPLKAFTPGIASLRGKGEYDVTIAGSWDAPVLTGRIGLSETVASIDTFPYMIGPIDGSILFTEERFTFESVRADLAGGVVEMSGVGFMKQLSLERLFVTASINGLKMRPLEGVRATLDGALFYETSPVGSMLSGDLVVSKARYGKRFEWKSLLLGMKDAGLSDRKLSSYYGDTEVNIHLSGTDRVTIDNNIARAPVELDLIVTGTLSRYGLIGKIEAREGQIYFRSNEFEIIEGRVDFTDPNGLFPVFHILAETSTGGYQIRLNLDGSMDNFTLALFSDPPLSDTNILTLLTSGQIHKEERGLESGIAAGEATAILTGGIQDVIEEEFKDITGFERFEITPQTTVTGAVSPKVTVGKRMLDDKLTVIYSTSIGTTEEHIIKMQYDLGGNVSVVGTRDELGSAGVDLQYRFEFR